jgi:hypothetical protein
MRVVFAAYADADLLVATAASPAYRPFWQGHLERRTGRASLGGVGGVRTLEAFEAIAGGQTPTIRLSWLS